MGLVDYSSSSSDSDSSPPPAAKKTKLTNPATTPSSPDNPIDPKTKPDSNTNTNTRSKPPPLPASFHDLYSSTVRRSLVDDPSLHDGRKRQTPHVQGNWPSHIYVEWIPPDDQYFLLAEFVSKTQSLLGKDVQLHNFLTSDLGAPLPLHISLSRPLSLTTQTKESFLEKTASSISSSGIKPFTVSPHAITWFRSPDSNRTFLVLQVSSRSSQDRRAPQNPQLSKLLNRFNDIAVEYSLPLLYASTSGELDSQAFHISIAWTFTQPDDEAANKVLALFSSPPFHALKSWAIHVSGIKVKIGNTVTHAALDRLE